MKEHIMWCIKHPDGNLMPWYGAHSLRKDCIKNWDPNRAYWKVWYRKGYRAVKVIVKQKS
jgi:hypothetical protein